MMLSLFFFDFFTARIRYFTIVHHLRLYIVIDKRWFFTYFVGSNFELGNSQRILCAHLNDTLRYVIIIVISNHLSSGQINTFFSFQFASLSITFKFSLKSKITLRFFLFFRFQHIFSMTHVPQHQKLSIYLFFFNQF